MIYEDNFMGDFMKCKYCGKDIKTVGNNLESLDGINAAVCDKNTSKKHAAVPDGVHCIYCGRKVKTLGDRIVTSHGISCPASPSGKHVL